MRYFLVLAIALVSKPMVQVRPRAAQSGAPAAASVGNESSNEALLATYKLLEKAMQTGDGDLYLSVHSQVKLDQTDKQAQERFRKGFPADPSVRYEVIAVK